MYDIRIPPRRGRKPSTEPKASRPSRGQKGGDKTSSRFLLEMVGGRAATIPAFDAPYIVNGTTKYPTTLTHPSIGPVLKSGKHQAKVGGKVLKGKWKGMAIYCLTLEERATCPTDCSLWRSCYGNGMHWSHRFMHGPALEKRIEIEVQQLAVLHPEGFVVRLHILGDFYSVDYVNLWTGLVDTVPQLHIFGYTARWKRDDPIGQALLIYAEAHWDRFAMRFSNAPVDTCSTVTIEHAAQKPADAIICPAQLGQSESCSTCALCFQSNRRIAFVRH